MIRVALYGSRGAGKSTLSRIISSALGDDVIVFHSAKPLYDIQSRLYKYAGLKSGDKRQDGVTLAEIARILRRLNPNSLADIVSGQADLANVTPAKLFLCDDSVPADRERLRSAGFIFVHVHAGAELRSRRRIHRGDIRSASDTNDPDVPLFDSSDFSIQNEAGLEDLERSARSLLMELGI